VIKPLPLLDWENKVLDKALKKAPERVPDFRTGSGLPAERVACPAEPDEAYLALQTKCTELSKVLSSLIRSLRARGSKPLNP